MKKILMVLLVMIAVAAHAQVTRIELPPPFINITNDQFFTYDGNLYLVLNDGINQEELFRFDGSTFHQLDVPDRILFADMIHFEGFRDEIFMVGDSPPRLFKFNGDFEEIVIPTTLGVQPYLFSTLCSYRDKLYITYTETTVETDTPIIGLMSYDGTDFQLHPFPDGTHFPGRDSGGVNFGGIRVYSDLVYLFLANDLDELRLVTFDGTRYSILSPLSGVTGEMEVYNDRLYLAREHGLYEIGGSEVSTFGGATPAVGGMEAYNGLLHYIGQSPDGRSTKLYSFNGSDIRELVPTFNTIQSTDIKRFGCYLFLNLRPIGGSSALYSYGMCMIRLPIPLPIAPYRRFIFNFDLMDRGTGIFSDWEGDPHSFQLTLTGENGKEIYSEKFQEPFKFKLPDTETPYTITMAMQQDSALSDLFVFDKSLLTAGIESVSIDIKPYEESFQLLAKTKNDEKVPFKLTLLDKDGNVKWMGEYTAPFEGMIKSETEISGDTLKVEATVVQKPGLNMPWWTVAFILMLIAFVIWWFVRRSRKGQ